MDFQWNLRENTATTKIAATTIIIIIIIIMEADSIKQVEMKEKITKEYLRRTRKLLKIKLSGRYLIKEINAWSVSLMRYSGPFLKWTREEPQQMDQRTKKKKLLTMHKDLKSQRWHWQYVSKKEGGRGLTTIQDSVDASIQRLDDYMKKNIERLISVTRNNLNSTRNNKARITTKQKWEEIQLYWFFKR